MSVDPLADSYPGWSPYNYVMNNPMSLVDPSGTCPEGYKEGDTWNGASCMDDGIVIEAERSAEPFGGFGFAALDSNSDGEPEGQTFYFDASTEGGYQAFHDLLMQSNDMACSMVGNEQFSMNARSAAMAACIHSGQAAFLDHPYSQAFLGLVYGAGVGAALARSAGILASRSSQALARLHTGISQAAYTSKTLGVGSRLFGIGRNGLPKGVLNSGTVRVGWSYSKPTHEHIFRIGIGNNPRFYPATQILGRTIHSHRTLLRVPASF